MEDKKLLMLAFVGFSLIVLFYMGYYVGDHYGINQKDCSEIYQTPYLDQYQKELWKFRPLEVQNGNNS